MHTTGNHIQYLMINHNGKEYEKEYTYVELSHFAVQQKLTQHCKSTILQNIYMYYLTNYLNENAFILDQMRTLTMHSMRQTLG